MVDPSLGVRNRRPSAAHGSAGREGEAVLLVKTALRSGYHGLACIIAVHGTRSSRPSMCGPR